MEVNATYVLVAHFGVATRRQPERYLAGGSPRLIGVWLLGGVDLDGLWEAGLSNGRDTPAIGLPGDLTP
ncbi:MAG: hypothetical protein WBB22_14685 [Anaerolineae bacterium]